MNAVVAELVRGIEVADELESAHQAETLRWLGSTDDVYRRVKPRTPERHLVSYFLPVDGDRVLLVEHRAAGLWLPPGGHVEVGEHPWATVQREAREELGIVDARPESAGPAFITVTLTNEALPHTDVSLWYTLTGDSGVPLDWDRREFRSIRWWTPEEIAAQPAERFDPHLSRFLVKTRESR